MLIFKNIYHLTGQKHVTFVKYFYICGVLFLRQTH